MKLLCDAPLEPHELRLLRNVLDDICLEQHVSITDPAATAIASELLVWYEFGIRGRDQLKAILQPL